MIVSGGEIMNRADQLPPSLPHLPGSNTVRHDRKSVSGVGQIPKHGLQVHVFVFVCSSYTEDVHLISFSMGPWALATLVKG